MFIVQASLYLKIIDPNQGKAFGKAKSDLCDGSIKSKLVLEDSLSSFICTVCEH